MRSGRGRGVGGVGGGEVGDVSGRGAVVEVYGATVAGVSWIEDENVAVGEDMNIGPKPATAGRADDVKLRRRLGRPRARPQPAELRNEKENAQESGKQPVWLHGSSP